MIMDSGKSVMQGHRVEFNPMAHSIRGVRFAARSELRFATWLIPMIYALGATLAGMLFPEFEATHFPHLVAKVTPAAAMAVYSAVASGMLALTGVVFSLAFVMIQFSATAYSPRLVLWVSRDPFLWHAVGVFTATCLYSVAALFWVDRNHSGAVPFISGWIVVALLVGSVLMFIGLIQRVGRLQIRRMLSFIGDQGRTVIEAYYPPSGAAALAADESFRQLRLVQTLTHEGPPQSMQAIDATKLIQLAGHAGAVIEVVSAVGDTLVELTPVLKVYGAHHSIDEGLLARAIAIGDERTFEQDPKYALRLLVDVAIRALSPAVNDPTTAVQSLDQIEDLLLRIGLRHLEVGEYRDSGRRLRLVVPCPRWEDFLRLAFDETRYCGARSVQVMRRMRALISDLIAQLPEKRQDALRHWQERLRSTVMRSFEDEEEKLEASVEDRQGLGVPRQRLP
jgi:uncharacterized membrane protein